MRPPLLLVLPVALGCSPGAATPPASDETGGAGADVSPVDPACSVDGRWELTFATEGGCPLPTGVVLVDGEGQSPGADRVPPMDWTLDALGGSGGTCRYGLEGRAGRLFRVDAELTTHAGAVTGSGHATPGRTRYGCAATVQISGRRR